MLTFAQVILGFLITTLLAFLIAFTVLFLDRIEDIVNFYRRHFQKDKPEYEQNHVGFDHEGPYWRSITFWSRVLSKNLLSLSDTQLLTGLAIQITAMIKHCSMSVYHFRIVVDLAFLTTVTHLLTVVTLIILPLRGERADRRLAIFAGATLFIGIVAVRAIISAVPL